MDNRDGIIYLNVGKKMLVRLYVSIYSLRKNNPDINISVAYYEQGRKDRDEDKMYDKLKKDFGCNIIKINDKVQKHIKENNLKPLEGSKWVLLLKTLTHVYTPYTHNTVFVDADTIVLNKKIHDILLDVPNDFGVTRFSDWKVNKRIKKRIDQFKDCIAHGYIEDAYKEKYAINCGVFAFNKDSKFMKNWYTFAEAGRNSFIPDEIACQIMLAHFPCYIMPNTFNRSCKYDTITEYTNIIHFHGRKHCRFDSCKPMYNSNIWLDYYIEKEEELKHYVRFDRFLNLNKHNIEEYKNANAQ